MCGWCEVVHERAGPLPSAHSREARSAYGGPMNARLPAWLCVSLLLAAASAFGAQTCPAGNVLATPDSDLIDNGDNTVTHARTGLMWKQCVEGAAGPGCFGTPTSFLWAEAHATATLNNIRAFAGHTDWR